MCSHIVGASHRRSEAGGCLPFLRTRLIHGASAARAARHETRHANRGRCARAPTCTLTHRPLQRRPHRWDELHWQLRLLSERGPHDKSWAWRGNPVCGGRGVLCCCRNTPEGSIGGQARRRTAPLPSSVLTPSSSRIRFPLGAQRERGVRRRVGTLARCCNAAGAGGGGRGPSVASLQTLWSPT